MGNLRVSEAVTQRCSVKKVFLESCLKNFIKKRDSGTGILRNF